MNQTFSVKDTNISGESRLRNPQALWIRFNKGSFEQPWDTPARKGAWNFLQEISLEVDVRECASCDIDLKLETLMGQSLMEVFSVFVYPKVYT